MLPSLSVVLAVGAVACTSLAGCREAQSVAPPVTPSRYISIVEALLDPPARLASTIAEQAAPDPPTPPTRRRLQGLVDSARSRLSEFRAIRLDDAQLRRQRDRLAGAYAALVPHMQIAADAVAADSDDRAARARAAGPFLDALRSLPSDAAASPSR